MTSPAGYESGKNHEPQSLASLWGWPSGLLIGLYFYEVIGSSLGAAHCGDALDWTLTHYALNSRNFPSLTVFCHTLSFPFLACPALYRIEE